MLPCTGTSKTASSPGKGGESNPIQPGLFLTPVTLLPLFCSVTLSGRAKRAGSPPLQHKHQSASERKVPKETQNKPDPPVGAVSGCHPCLCEVEAVPRGSTGCTDSPGQAGWQEKQSLAVPGANPACWAHSLPQGLWAMRRSC